MLLAASARMTTSTKLFLVLGVASITYGVARWQIVTELLAKQDAHFEQFLSAHAWDSTSQPTAQEVIQLRKRVMLSGGLYPGWPQAIVPVALGLMFLTAGYYLGQRSTKVEHETTG
jgi:hypothetical protein